MQDGVSCVWFYLPCQFLTVQNLLFHAFHSHGVWIHFWHRVSQNTCLFCTGCHKTHDFFAQGIYKSMVFLHRVSQKHAFFTGCTKICLFLQGVTKTCLFCTRYLYKRMHFLHRVSQKHAFFTGCHKNLPFSQGGTKTCFLHRVSQKHSMYQGVYCMSTELCINFSF